MLTFKFSITAFILFSLATGCIMLAGYFFLQMHAEVNRKLPENEQISYWGGHLEKYIRIKREYKRLYPSGKLDRIGTIIMCLGFVLLLLFAATMGAFR